MYKTMMLSSNKNLHKIKVEENKAWKHLCLFYFKLSEQNKAESPITM